MLNELALFKWQLVNRQHKQPFSLVLTTGRMFLYLCAMAFNFLKRLFGPAKPLFPPDYFFSDKKFNSLYPAYIQKVARKHFTPLGVAQMAAEFLAKDEAVKILDIGSGAGKFCAAAAYYTPKASYFGVELRENLLQNAELIKNKLQLNNITFIKGNFTDVDFTQFNHFYFYNSFYENIVDVGRIDEALPFSKEQYSAYNAALFKCLEPMPAGTRLVTFHVATTELPPSFKVTREEIEGFLKFCVKV